ncbi:hypothetical protein ATE84_2976 [Aquimarina sp. MAR_2010_214]|uniref:hypothetical protein n=1 Tax=Aquimarina sp. MAR_2010_214 TaxID=1250026 RepID=UPI000C70978F|nr:hypothetical protein [Aquimarina sp. MAR_2010_214]PKV50907.1 hypothetical protein ATE84_2976 [Aquimarina sp. MAR_2010_214]
MKKILISIGMIVVLVVIGFLIKGSFLDISFSQLNKRNIKIVSYTMSEQFKSHLIFTLSIGVIPVLYLISNKFSGLKSRNQTIATLGIIFGCGILSWQLRIFQLNNQLQKLSEYNLENGIQNSMDFQNLNFSTYLFIGFLIGALLSVLIFKMKNRSTTK